MLARGIDIGTTAATNAQTALIACIITHFVSSGDRFASRRFLFQSEVFSQSHSGPPFRCTGTTWRLDKASFYLDSRLFGLEQRRLLILLAHVRIGGSSAYQRS